VRARASRPKASAKESRRGAAQARLLRAVTEVVAREGYTQLTVEKLLVTADSSRATFYQYFSNIDDCFWTAYRLHAAQFVTDVEAEVRGSRYPDVAMLEALVATASAKPEITQLVMREGLAAGQKGLLERDAVVSKLAGAMAGSAASQCAIDLPAGILVGGILRFLSMRLADGGALDGLGREVRDWAQAFTRRCPGPSWSARLMPPFPCEEQHSSVRLIKVPPRGSPHERILRATAQTIRERGYRRVTVADIVAAAGVSRRAFYGAFPSKADAAIAAYEYGFEATVAACTPAFLGAAEWPERVWSSALAFTRFLSSEPLFAYLGFVQCYALGPRFASRVDHTQLAFSIFLEEGYRQRPEARSPSRACSALAVATIFEAGFQGSRHGSGLYIRRLQPLAVYVALAPFIGADEAGRFVMARLAEKDSARARSWRTSTRCPS
jgi:AcrR family transcriptional regulator